MARAFSLPSWFLAVAAAFLSHSIIVSGWATPPNATTVNGTYVGSYVAEYDQDLFLGMPYAQPPIGNLRFANPQSLNTSFNDTRDATSYSSECVGYGTDQWEYPIGEDCLYLNVVRPANYSSFGEPLPVGVWIHGGGFFEGGSPDKRYNLSFVVQNSVAIGKPFIGVSFNYRLSAWGFLASGQLAGEGTTNMALRDQRLALHWIQENIGAFGGDPSKVTIWGESAGAKSVGFHLIAFNGRDDKLFRGAIMESGNSVQPQAMFTADYFEAPYQALVDNVNCTDAIDVLGCLRSVPFDTLNTAINTTNATGWFPVIDGDFVARLASYQLEAGAYVHVPIISGANSDEGTAFGPVGINTTEEFLAFMEKGAGYPRIPLAPALAEEIINVYPDDPCDGIPGDLGCTRLNGTHGLEYRRTSAYIGDVVYIAPRRLQCQTWAAGGTPAYCYRFNTRPNGIPIESGVTHFQEVAFVFDNTNGYGYDVTPDPFAGVPASYFALAKLMSNSWASFIHDLDPNSFRRNDTVTPQWPVYDNADPQGFVWDANVTGLAYPEPDTFRASGISTILSFNRAFRR
ncbi:Alpha/Beta hydrolase protein [Fomitopsis serialis]|uniref:Alpha/Beta hydrolase protein n=1 Tax=Fomitopsis serialis TaxID=139415 RepID=UPI0020077127|nr:Alpha/Beta hydrolase protein [Neoantrodia serialis]KAH9937174.1 Alpha/Beta hydrolase protein [Neoantrodia serialis]